MVGEHRREEAPEKQELRVRNFYTGWDSQQLFFEMSEGRIEKIEGTFSNFTLQLSAQILYHA